MAGENKDLSRRRNSRRSHKWDFPVEPGFAKRRIEPEFEDLKLVEGSHPTPKGVISVRHERIIDAFGCMKL